MKRLVVISFLLFIVASVLQAAPPKRVAAPTPEFWYVVPGEARAADATAVVRGIVVPTSVRPTVQTTPAGSVISWKRPDGTRQSFVVEGVSSFTFESGPLTGTTYVPFQRSRHLVNDPNSCCSCASWQNSVESIDRLACVAGCLGCGCEGCICSPGLPCPTAPEGSLTLVAHNDVAKKMTFVKSNEIDTITMGGRGDAGVQFKGRHVTATMTPMGETVIRGPESITLPGGIAERSRVRDDKAFYAWSSPYASVILEQPQSMPAPLFHDGKIDLNVPAVAGRANSTRRPTIAPVMDDCRVCGTHPNSVADLELYDCVPGDSVCYRCITWRC